MQPAATLVTTFLYFRASWAVVCLWVRLQPVNYFTCGHDCAAGSIFMAALCGRIKLSYMYPMFREIASSNILTWSSLCTEAWLPLPRQTKFCDVTRWHQNRINSLNFYGNRTGTIAFKDKMCCDLIAVRPEKNHWQNIVALKLGSFINWTVS